MKKIIIILSAVALVALIGVTLASNKHTLNENNKLVDRSQVKIPVIIDKAIESQVVGGFTLPALVEPVKEVNLSLNSSGKIKNLNFETGTFVTKGQVIGGIDNNLKQINLESSQLLVDKYEKDYQRLKELYQGKAATEVDFNNSTYNYENAKTQLALIKQQINDGLLIAPISGVIIKKNIEVGEFVNLGTVIATLVDTKDLKARVQVGERDVYQLKEGMSATIQSDIFPGKDFKGKIRFISPVGDDAHNYEVEISIDNSSSSALKSGTFIRVAFDIPNNSEALQISKKALVEGMKNPFVYVVENGKAVIKKLVLGRDLGENIEVVSGIKVGDDVIISGQINLINNSPVEIINVAN